MNTLFLNLASHESMIACCDDKSIAVSESVHTRISDKELIPLVESVLEKAGWGYQDLDRIACVVGPGGFTSLRVAVTCANVLSDQLGVPSAGIHLSEIYKARVGDREIGNLGNWYWLHSTKKDQLFIQGGEYEEPTLISVDQLSTLHSTLSTLHWCGELIPEHRSIINQEPIELVPVTDVLPEFLSLLSYETQTLTPWYGRGW